MISNTESNFCVWSVDDNFIYHTDCGAVFSDCPMVQSPDFRLCPSCGREIHIK